MKLRAALIILPLLVAGGVFAAQELRPPAAAAAAPAQKAPAQKASVRRAPAASAGLTVVELFTSQGCSSCPPANLAVARLADTRPDVLALTYGVEVWDHLGWKDTNALSAFSRRQVEYNRQFGKRGVYTPQVVVGGEADLPGSRPGQIERLMAQAGPVPASPKVSLTSAKAIVGAGPAPQERASVLLVRYNPRPQQVPIRRGENGGRTLLHKNVVRELVVLGPWTGAAASYPLPAPKQPGLLNAVLVQDPRSGRLLGAAKG